VSAHGAAGGRPRNPGVAGLTNPLIVALDTDDPRRLAELAAAVAPHAGLLKVGLQAFTALGPAAVTTAGQHAEVFFDGKLHDIPNTVAAAAAAAARMGIAMLTVHASGGPAMIAGACKAAPEITILAVTVLTSLDDADLAVVGQPPVAQQVVRLAGMAVEAGAGGVVCAAGDVGRPITQAGDPAAAAAALLAEIA
jgi:orotidine-5'-phosphate decarboxylase